MLQNFLIPQVDDNMGPDELPNFLQDVCNLLENHYPGRWIGHGGGHMAWTPRSLDFTPLDFTLWDFVKDIVYMPLMPNSIGELKIRISQATLWVDEEMPDRIMEEL